MFGVIPVGSFPKMGWEFPAGKSGIKSGVKGGKMGENFLFLTFLTTGFLPTQNSEFPAGKSHQNPG